MTEGAYAFEAIAPVVLPDGDCWARARIRIAEMDASLAWLARIVERFPAQAPARVPLGPLMPERLVIALVEGWRGEVVHCLETGPGGELVHYKVQDPSLRNWMGLALAVRGNEISDFPICNKSFDLSYCGNDL
jgi:Ni,Fe-hydrogenase III large subunit